MAVEMWFFDHQALLKSMLMSQVKILVIKIISLLWSVV